jgi:non-homologous end joining protein Ku
MGLTMSAVEGGTDINSDRADEFVDRSEIDPRYLIRPYYLRPDGKVGHDAFAVIRETIPRWTRSRSGGWC